MEFALFFGFIAVISGLHHYGKYLVSLENIPAGHNPAIYALDEKVEDLISKIRHAPSESSLRSSMCKIWVAIEKYERSIGGRHHGIRNSVEAAVNVAAKQWFESSAANKIRRDDNWGAVRCWEGYKEFCTAGSPDRDKADKRIADLLSSQGDFL